MAATSDGAAGVRTLLDAEQGAIACATRFDTREAILLSSDFNMLEKSAYKGVIMDDINFEMAEMG
jgi:hypothetical protein